ncbi:hypothetical protein Tco_1334730 [Tanacetum coccineum]
MANLEFCDKHNMVAYLQKSEGSEGFHQIVNFLTASHIRYALTESSTIHVSLIEQFWQIVTASTLENGDMEITAIIDGKVKHKRLLLPHKRLYIAPTLTQKLFSNMKRASKGYTGVDTPLFQTMLVQGQILQGEGSTIPETEVPQPSSPTQTHVADEAASTGVDVRHGGAATTVSSLDAGQGSGNIDKTPAMPHDSPLLRVHTLGSDEGRMQHNELMDLVTKLSDRVVSLETDLQQTKKVYGAPSPILSKVKSVGRKIAQIDEDKGITLMLVLLIIECYIRAGAEISTASPKVKTASVSVDDVAAEGLVYIRRSAAKRKNKKRGKGLPVFIKKQALSNLKNGNIQAQIEADEELAHRLQAQERERYSEADKAKLLVKLINERKRQFAQQRAQQKRNRPVTQTQQSNREEELGEESLKRQKIREGSEPTEESKDKELDDLSQEQLQQLMIIVPEEGMNVEALQTKYPIIDWEVYTEDSRMDDLVKLWSLVHERFNSTKPTEDKEREL